MLHIIDRNTDLSDQPVSLVNATLQKGWSQSGGIILNAITTCVDVCLSVVGYFLSRIALGRLVSHNSVVR